MTDTPSPPPRRTPLTSVHEQLGASLTDFAGWLMPLRYGSETAEHIAVRTAAGIFDLSHMGELVVSGPDAGAALDFALKLKSRQPFGQRRVHGNTKVSPEGVLLPADYPALVHAFMRVAPTGERSLVSWVLVMEGLYAMLAIVVVLVHF